MIVAALVLQATEHGACSNPGFTHPFDWGIQAWYVPG